MEACGGAVVAAGGSTGKLGTGTCGIAGLESTESAAVMKLGSQGGIEAVGIDGRVFFQRGRIVAGGKEAVGHIFTAQCAQRRRRIALCESGESRARPAISGSAVQSTGFEPCGGQSLVGIESRRVEPPELVESGLVVACGEKCARTKHVAAVGGTVDLGGSRQGRKSCGGKKCIWFH